LRGGFPRIFLRLFVSIFLALHPTQVFAALLSFPSKFFSHIRLTWSPFILASGSGQSHTEERDMKIRKAAALLIIALATLAAPVVEHYFHASQVNPSLRADGVSPPPVDPIAS
jgi:hypothetical protein